jgi:hypothetical protein
MTAFGKIEVPLCVYSVEKLFQHHFRQSFWGHQTPNRAAFIDCRAFYEVSVFAAVVFELRKRVFQQNMSIGEISATKLFAG